MFLYHSKYCYRLGGVPKLWEKNISHEHKQNNCWLCMCKLSFPGMWKCLAKWKKILPEVQRGKNESGNPPREVEI